MRFGMICVFPVKMPSACSNQNLEMQEKSFFSLTYTEKRTRDTKYVLG